MLDKSRYLERMEELAETIYDPERLSTWIALWNKATRKQHAYWMALKDMDPQIFETTFNRIPLKFSRFPTIAEIINVAHTIATEQLGIPTREQAWRQVTSACSIYRQERDSVHTAYLRTFNAFDPKELEPSFNHPFLEQLMERFGGCETLEAGALAHHKQRFDTLWMELLEIQLDRIIYPQRERTFDQQIRTQLPDRQSA